MMSTLGLAFASDVPHLCTSAAPRESLPTLGWGPQLEHQSAALPELLPEIHVACIQDLALITGVKRRRPIFCVSEVRTRT